MLFYKQGQEIIKIVDKVDLQIYPLRHREGLRQGMLTLARFGVRELEREGSFVIRTKRGLTRCHGLIRKLGLAATLVTNQEYDHNRACYILDRVLYEALATLPTPQWEGRVPLTIDWPILAKVLSLEEDYSFEQINTSFGQSLKPYHNLVLYNNIRTGLERGLNLEEILQGCEDINEQVRRLLLYLEPPQESSCKCL